MHDRRLLPMPCLALIATAVQAQTPAAAPVGEIQGSAWVHTADSLAASVQQASLYLPAAATGGPAFCGRFADTPRVVGAQVPVIVFLHGSSVLGLKAIGEWQQWLAGLGWASIAPDSFALPGRVSYKSPIDKASYEKIHALRAAEIEPAVEAVKAQAWADAGRLVLAGTSEGAVPVARHAGTDFVAKMIYPWTCETKYFVLEPQNRFRAGQPVLNVISASDPFFSKANPWLGIADAASHCCPALKDEPRAPVVLVPGASHTLLNLPAVRHATAGFLTWLGRRGGSARRLESWQGSVSRPSSCSNWCFRPVALVRAWRDDRRLCYGEAGSQRWRLRGHPLRDNHFTQASVADLPASPGMASRARNTLTRQCDLPRMNCPSRTAAIDSPHGVHDLSSRAQRRHRCGGLSGLQVVVPAAVACRDGNPHPSAGRTSLGPAITSTSFAQTSDRRASCPRVGVRLPSADARPATEGIPRGSHPGRAHAH